MCQAYHGDSVLQAEALMESLAKELDKTHPGAAAGSRVDHAGPLHAPSARARQAVGDLFADLSPTLPRMTTRKSRAAMARMQALLIDVLGTQPPESWDCSVRGWSAMPRGCFWHGRRRRHDDVSACQSTSESISGPG